MMLVRVIRWAAVCVAWGCAGAASTVASATEPPKVDPEDLITELGIGRAQGYGKTIADLRRLYPEAQVTVERRTMDNGFPAQERKSWDSSPGDAVVRVNGEELFRADCMCEFVPSIAKWRIRQSDSLRIEEKGGIMPTTTNPKFKTVQGVGVGNTVSELRKAYATFSETHRWVFIEDKANWDRQLKAGQRSGQLSVIACMRSRREGPATARSPDFIGFRLEPVNVFRKPGEKVYAYDQHGRAISRERPFDPNAKVVEVLTYYDCYLHDTH